MWLLYNEALVTRLNLSTGFNGKYKTTYKGLFILHDTYMDNECRVVFLQFASEPQEVLVAPAYLVLTGVELAPCSLEKSSRSKR